MIWDVHTHLSGVEGRTPEEKMARLLAFADRMGVERVCVYMGYPFLEDPTPQQLRDQNDQVLKAISHHHDRAFGFVYLSAKHPDASLRELDRCVRDGPMVGVKLWIAKRCDDEQIDPIIRRAAELKALILQHTWFKATGNRPGESSPADFAAMARRHPKTPFVCGHTGGDWALGIRAVRDLPNVVADTGGSDPTTGFVEMAVRELGADRVLYGSDAGGRSFASQIAKVQGAAIPDAAKAKVFKDNLKRLLAPILAAKGMKP